VTLYSTWLIAKSVLIEAIRRREIYVIVLLASLLIGLIVSSNFYDLDGITKIYREVALRVMSLATALTVIVLAARQLPREFEARTIYPLLARPISRTTFMLGKLLGVFMAAAFCLGMFMTVYAVGSVHLSGIIHWPLFLQFIYLQLIMMLVLATLSFLMSLIFSLGATITLGVLFYIIGVTYSTMMLTLYDSAAAGLQFVFRILTYITPQLVLFDLTDRSVHAEIWSPLSSVAMMQLTVYSGVFCVVYFAWASVLFRRRPI
jgi:ABC-type transport system involved in multi-copper enzyme maturation permease subunit